MSGECFDCGHTICVCSGEIPARRDPREDILIVMLDRAERAEDALRDIQSQCAGHSDEFSCRVWARADAGLAIAPTKGQD